MILIPDFPLTTKRQDTPNTQRNCDSVRDSHPRTPRSHPRTGWTASATLITLLLLNGFVLVQWPFAPLHAQTLSGQSSPSLTTAAPRTVGMSEERLARIDRMLQQAIEDNRIPGAVALIARDGKIVYHKAFGDANGVNRTEQSAPAARIAAPAEDGASSNAETTSNQTPRPYRTDDIFRIASMTKAITSTAVMMLWEEGLFRLDDPISRYIPELDGLSVLDTYNATDTTYTARETTRQVTIRHLLTHTSGISYANIGRDPRLMALYRKAGVIDLVSSDPLTIADNVRILGELPLLHEPGEEYTYGLNTDILGYFVEVVSGISLDDFFRTRILDPLGMDDTWFYLPKAKHERLVPVLLPKDGQWTPLERTISGDPDYPINGAGTYFSGGAGLSSTAKDYATFLQMMLNKGELNGIRLLSSTTVDMMMKNHMGDMWNGRDTHIGLAFGVLTEKGEQIGGKGSAGTFDWGGYFNTQYFADPEERIIGVLMKQTLYQQGDETAWKFRQMVFSAVDD